LTQFTDESAAAARGRGVLHASASGTLFQGVYALSQFVILAALLRYIGAERFGMWTTIWSFGIWALLANLGIHHALLTRVGQIAMTDRERAGRVLGTSLMLVAGVSGGLIVLALVIVPALPWPAILKVQGDQAVREASPVMLTALVMVLLGLPASLGGSALLACQRGRSAYAASTVAHIGCAATVATGVGLGWPLLWLVVVVMSPPLLAGALQWLMLLTGPHALPPGRFNRREATGLFRIGFGFFVLELFTIGLLQTGSIIIAQTHGAAAVTPYAAMYRLIGLVQAVYLAVVFAYWPAFGEAAHRGDHQWFGRALRWSFAKTTGVWLASALGIYLLGDWFIRWWLGPEALPTFSLKVWMIAFVGLHGLLLWVTTPLKGVGRLGSQLIGGAAMMVLFIPLAVWLCVRYGAAGVPIAQSVVILLVGLPINFVSIRRVTRWPAL
jgi:O-antigen/teichoic acid export membrane protein